MAGRYSRTYTRKKSTAPPPISQFDRLISEHGKGTHPVASKTAGHVGKWGVTSFTSLRSINENYGKEEPGKRSWQDSSPPPSSGDTVNSDVSAVCESSKGGGGIPVKRRKFFKSRDFNSVDSAVSSSNCEETNSDLHTSPTTPVTSDEFSGQNCAPSFNSVSFRNRESSLPKNQKHNSVVPPINKGGGGIKLKIFKSKNSDVNAHETYSSTVQLPSDDSGSSSNSSSVANSPKPDPVAQVEVKSVQSPNGLVLPDPHRSECDLVDPVESLKENLPTGNISINADFKSNSNYYKINEKFQPTLPSHNLEVPENTVINPPFLFSLAEDRSLSETNSLGEKENLETNPPHTISVDQSCIDNSNILVGKEESCSSDTEFSGSLKLKIKSNQTTCEGFIVSSNKEDRGFSIEDGLTIEGQGALPSDSKKSDEEGDMDLFSTDFDENEIVDRTTIEYPSEPGDISFKPEPLKQSDTIDLDDAEPSNTPSISRLNLRSSSYSSALSQQAASDTSKSLNSRKKSIFKSRQKEGESKKRATYKHKWHGHEDKDDSFKKEEALKRSASIPDKASEDPFEFDTTPVLKKVQTWPTSQLLDNSFEEENVVTSVKCPKQAKKYYTVVKNVKKTHQLQESGEFQEFNDDVEYFLDALRSSNSISTRCLASLNLAQKCMTPAFRMHLRAHATVAKFFRALSDAPSHPQLAECAAMVMFALSQDRLNMDLDRSSLELMLNLLDADSSLSESSVQLSDAAAADHSSKIRSLCKELQTKGHAKHLKLDNIKAASLAMETLLSLTSMKSGKEALPTWFKEELRKLGGVDHLIRTVTAQCHLFAPDIQCWTPRLVEKMAKIERCLKVLESVTYQNQSNQEYLLRVNEGEFCKTLMRLFRMCHTEVPLNPLKPQDELTLSTYNPAAARVIISTLITTIKVLINLTHGSNKEALGSKILGVDLEIYDISIYCLLLMPIYLDHDTKFEVQVLACCLLLNLVENSPENRHRLMNLRSPTEDISDDIMENRERETAMASLVALFYTSEESARIQEAHTDQIIDKDLTQETKEEDKKDEEIEETVARLLQKAGRHMEDTLIAAYTALLAGYCLMDNKEFEKKIRYLQPEGHFKTMVAVLKKFLRFMNLSAATSLLRTLKPTERVVKYMEQLDRTPEEEEEERRKKEEAKNNMVYEAFGF